MALDWQGNSFGDPRVSYDDSGRPLFSDDAVSPRNLLRWRETNVPTVERTQPVASGWSFRPWGSLKRPQGQQETAPPPHIEQDSAVFVTRRHDYPSLLSGPKYVDYPAATKTTEPLVYGSAQHIIYPSRTHMEAVVVDEMKVYNDRPFLFWLFIVDGVALIVLGILSLLWCLSWDVMFYSRFWTGILLILFGTAGAIHRGDYYKRVWKSWLFIILGVVTAAAVKACTCFTLNIFCHQLIEVIQFNSWTDYKAEMLYRITNLPDYPRNNLSTSTFPNDNLIACFVMDGIQVLLLMIAFLTVTSLMLVIDRFYNSHFVITRMVEPFCEPRLFNPFGQVSMGQAQIFIGFVLQASVHGAEEFLWQRTYAPVWAGIIPCLAGVFTALSLKSCGLKHRIWNMLSVILEILTIVGSIVAIILVTIGMVQHYDTLGSTPVMTHTGFAQRLIVASIFLFCISDITCIINIFYAIALLVRLIICICCAKAEDQVPMITYVEDDFDDPVLFPSTAEYQKFRFLDKQKTLADFKNIKTKTSRMDGQGRR